MKLFSQRRTFTTLMTIFATTFCVAVTGQVLGGQADLFADILKTAVLIATGTAVLSYIVWTLTHLKRDSISRGVTAGFLTAVMVIPLPAFVSNLKTQTFSAYQTSTENLVVAFFSAIPPAIDAGLYAFVDITKASLIAVTASMILGAAISVYIKPRDIKPGV